MRPPGPGYWGPEVGGGGWPVGVGGVLPVGIMVRPSGDSVLTGGGL